MKNEHNGCEELHILKNDYFNYKKRYDSKVEGIETLLGMWEKIILKKELPEIKEAIKNMENELLNTDTGKVTKLWEDRKSIFRAVRWLIITVVGALLASLVTQNFHQVRTERYLEQIFKVEKSKLE